METDSCSIDTGMTQNGVINSVWGILKDNSEDACWFLRIKFEFNRQSKSVRQERVVQQNEKLCKGLETLNSMEYSGNWNKFCMTGVQVKCKGIAVSNEAGEASITLC